MPQPRPKELDSQQTSNGATVTDPLDTALLIVELRRTWRLWRDRAAHADDESARAAYRQAMGELEAAIRDQGDQRRVWAAFRTELVAAIRDALHENTPASDD